MSGFFNWLPLSVRFLGILSKWYQRPLAVILIWNLWKLILIVRDPIDRLVSDYLQIKAKLESENRTVGTLEHLALKDGKVNEQYPAVSTSRYAIHLEKWLKYFPLEQIHIGTDHFHTVSTINLINMDGRWRPYVPYAKMTITNFLHPWPLFRTSPTYESEISTKNDLWQKSIHLMWRMSPWSLWQTWKNSWILIPK